MMSVVACGHILVHGRPQYDDDDDDYDGDVDTGEHHDGGGDGGHGGRMITWEAP